MEGLTEKDIPICGVTPIGGNVEPGTRTEIPSNPTICIHQLRSVEDEGLELGLRNGHRSHRVLLVAIRLANLARDARVRFPCLEHPSFRESETQKESDHDDPIRS